jgi:hypothetical protein
VIPSREIEIAIKAYEAAYGPIAPGATVRVNHEGCLAGEDKRKRFYLTSRASGMTSGGAGDGAILAYCHNCGHGGVSHNTGFARYRTGTHVASPASRFELPELLPMYDPSVPTEAHDFLRVVAPTHVQQLGIGWDAAECRVVLPVYDRVDWRGIKLVPGELIAYQSRRIFGNGPKYITAQRDDGPMESIFGEDVNEMQVPMVCVVEDLLSAYCVATGPTGCAAAPMFRYQIRAEYLAKLVKVYKNVIVWLDNDKEEVKAESVHITRLVRAYGGKSFHMGVSPEPKKCDMTKVDENINLALTEFRRHS